MADFLKAHGSEILSAIIGAIGGASISVPITLRITRNARTSNVTNTDQSRARAGGDIVGRDKSTR